jgi:MinD superfamily P-loop ATPase
MIARTQAEHEEINRREYPGTRQLCERCGDPTERCEEDAIFTDSGKGPLCVGCYDAANAPRQPEPASGDRLDADVGGKDQS